jgi:hypothetical protein
MGAALEAASRGADARAAALAQAEAYCGALEGLRGRHGHRVSLHICVAYSNCLLVAIACLQVPGLYGCRTRSRQPRG